MKKLLPTSVLSISLLACSAAYAQNTETELSDALIEGKLISTYTLNEQLNPFVIEVDSNEGVVTLSGTVESEVERELAIQLAKSIENVNQVNDELEVKPEAERSASSDEGFAMKVKNATTTAKIKSQLLWNSQTDGLDIKIDTHDGMVTLEGTVASEAESEMAESIAYNTTGVKAVMNQLVVDPSSEGNLVDKTKDAAKETAEVIKEKAKNVGTAMKDTAEDMETAVKDTWITTKVKSLMSLDRRFENTDLDIDTDAGTVTLTGTIPAGVEQQELVEAIQYIKGVKSVDAQLQVTQ
jgi:osmotically-inducible protein OsmY